MWPTLSSTSFRLIEFPKGIALQGRPRKLA
jgi:hypothetical protein